MNKQLAIEGAFQINTKNFVDCRGIFEETWSYSYCRNLGVQFAPTSVCHSLNINKNTIRAFHFQEHPFGQSKIVSCLSGSAWDVVVDLRHESPSFLKWCAVDLLAFSGTCIYIPKGCAHGFLALEDNTTLAYLIEGEYRPQYSKVIRWNDPLLSIRWPTNSPVLSERDSKAPSIQEYLSETPKNTC